MKIRRMWHRTVRYEWPRLLIRAGLRSAHTEYTRFLILSTSRSGSTLLMHLLQQHPHIRAFGEVFRNLTRPEPTISWDIDYYPQYADWRRLYREHPVRFLRACVYAPQPTTVRAVGFKLFYFHARNEAGRPVWDALADDRELNVIDLERRDLLAMYLSWERATRHRAFAASSKRSPTASEPITLDPEACRTFFERRNRNREHAMSYFKDHKVFTLSYEELSEHPAEQVQRVFRFLGQEDYPVTARLQKQSRGSLRDNIRNYDELRNHFIGTPWALYFQD